MQILRDRGVDLDLIYYLKDPPDESTLRDLSRKMGLAPSQFIRKNEAIYRELKLQEKLDDPDELFRQMAAHPRLIQRPIIVKEDRAVLGRPPDRALEIV